MRTECYRVLDNYCIYLHFYIIYRESFLYLNMLGFVILPIHLSFCIYLLLSKCNKHVTLKHCILYNLDASIPLSMYDATVQLLLIQSKNCCTVSTFKCKLLKRQFIEANFTPRKVILTNQMLKLTDMN